MKTYVLLILIYLVSVPLSGQSVVKQTLAINGSSDFVYANNRSYFLQQSIGQASVIHTFTADNYTLRQGFLQPVKAALIDSGFDTEIEALIYPNPFDNEVNIQFEETMIDVITISLHHITGQLIYQRQFDPSELINLTFNDLPVGTYILRGQMRAQTFVTKLIKR